MNGRVVKLKLILLFFIGINKCYSSKIKIILLFKIIETEIKKNFLDENIIWNCNFERDSCNFTKDSPDYLNLFKFERGIENFQDFQNQNSFVFFSCFFFLNFN